jgi:serine/threonine protein kinase
MDDPDQEHAARRIGAQVGNWTLESVLGVGGMASVYLGRRPDGAVGAVKILHEHFNHIDELRKRFLREGPIGNALAAMAPVCEGLPHVFESGVLDDATTYLVMEVLAGETVFDRMARLRVLPVDEVLWIAQKTLDVLSVAHTHGVVHRDLKPENLHIGAGGRIKVLDFGVARVTGAFPDHIGQLPEQSATRTGTALGSCEYMAPEQAIGNVREIDGRTDLFGLGATLFRLLSGQLVHGDLMDANLMIAAATQEAPKLATAAPHLVPAVCAVIDRALAFAKTQRYPDAATMRFDVIALRSGREPPYVAAVAAGRIAAGAGLFSG